MNALWYGILAVMLTTYIVLDAGWLGPCCGSGRSVHAYMTNGRRLTDAWPPRERSRLLHRALICHPAP